VISIEFVDVVFFANDYSVHQAMYISKRTLVAGLMAQKRHKLNGACTKGCVYNRIELAEREGFEPSIQVLARITV
jgi:hypothetical protein